MINKKVFPVISNIAKRNNLLKNLTKIPIRNFSLNLNLNFSHLSNSLQINSIKLRGNENKNNQNEANEEIRKFINTNLSKIKNKFFLR